MEVHSKFTNARYLAGDSDAQFSPARVAQSFNTLERYKK